MKPTGSTAKSCSYRGTAGGIKGQRIGGGTTFPASAKGRLQSGGAGKQTGGKFKQAGNPMRGKRGY